MRCRHGPRGRMHRGRRAMTFTIDKSLPIARSHQIRSRYPLEAMEVNDSFMIACEPEEIRDVRNRFSNATWRYAKKHVDNKKFIPRAIQEAVRYRRRERKNAV